MDMGLRPCLGGAGALRAGREKKFSFINGAQAKMTSQGTIPVGSAHLIQTSLSSENSSINSSTREAPVAHVCHRTSHLIRVCSTECEHAVQTEPTRSLHLRMRNGTQQKSSLSPPELPYT